MPNCIYTVGLWLAEAGPAEGVGSQGQVHHEDEEEDEEVQGQEGRGGGGEKRSQTGMKRG